MKDKFEFKPTNRRVLRVSLKLIYYLHVYAGLQGFTISSTAAAAVAIRT